MLTDDISITGTYEEKYKKNYNFGTVRNKQDFQNLNKMMKYKLTLRVPSRWKFRNPNNNYVRTVPITTIGLIGKMAWSTGYNSNTDNFSLKKKNKKK